MLLKLLDTGMDQAFRVVENFQKVAAFVNSLPILKGRFVFKELTVAAAGTYTPLHRLDFIPKDVITLHVSAGTVTWNYSSFDRDKISFTTSAACTIRAFFGVYSEDA